MLNNDSELYLLKDVELDADSEHTIDFDDATQQYNYFYSKIDRTLLNTDDNADFAYIREQKAINVAFNIDDLFGVNYLMYNNDKKWYYAYIIRKEFVSPETTKLHIKLDTYQTFMFDFELDECFVEREHQDRYEINPDTDANLIPIYNHELEQLDKGDTYILEKETEIITPSFNNASSSYKNYEKNIYWLCVITSEKLDVKSSWKPAKTGAGDIDNASILKTFISGISSNAYTYYLPIVKGRGGYNFLDKSNSTIRAVSISQSTMQSLASNPSVLSISLIKYPPFNYYCTIIDSVPHFYPSVNSNGIDLYMSFLTTATSTTGMDAIYLIQDTPRDLLEQQSLITYTLDRTKPIDALQINNQKDINLEPKLQTNEFKYLEVSYGTNIKQTFNIEDFTTDYNEIYFKFLPPINVNGGGMIVPLDYQDTNYQKAITLNATFTDLPLVYDQWKQYLANHKNSMITGFITNSINTFAGIGVGMATGGMGLAIAGMQTLNYAGQIANQVAQIKDLKNAPDKVNKTALDTFLDLITTGINIKISLFSIRDSYKHKIYNYLYHYGYKCNDFKKPNVRSRYYFNYIKTIDANIKSNISNEYITELKALFDKGITIWHYRDDATFKGIRNYAFENVEMALMPTNE